MLKVVIWRRARAAMSEMSLLRISWAIIALLAASVVVVAAFNPGGVDVFEDPGSVADWVAGVGTWIVGYGAIAISIAASHREKAEQARVVAADIQAGRSELLTFLFRASPITAARAMARDSAEVEGMPPQVAILILNTAVGQLNSLSWNDLDLSRLNKKSEAAFYQLQICIRYFKIACEHRIYAEEHPELSEHIIPQEELLTQADDMEKALREFMDAVRTQLRDSSAAGGAHR